MTRPRVRLVVGAARAPRMQPALFAMFPVVALLVAAAPLALASAPDERATTAAASAAAEESARPVVPLSVAEFRRMLESRRGQVLVLNLWASWCTPCLKEIPALLELQARYAACGVQVLGLATDDPVELTGPVQSLHAKYFPAFESYARTEGEPDSYASVVDPAWNELMPTTYVIDATGRTAVRLQGGKSVQEFAAALDPLVRCSGRVDAG